jgi:hypothetical protein
VVLIAIQDLTLLCASGAMCATIPPGCRHTPDRSDIPIGHRWQRGNEDQTGSRRIRRCTISAQTLKNFTCKGYGVRSRAIPEESPNLPRCVLAPGLVAILDTSRQGRVKLSKCRVLHRTVGFGLAFARFRPALIEHRRTSTRLKQQATVFGEPAVRRCLPERCSTLENFLFSAPATLLSVESRDIIGRRVAG